MEIVILLLSDIVLMHEKCDFSCGKGNDNCRSSLNTKVYFLPHFFSYFDTTSRKHIWLHLKFM